MTPSVSLIDRVLSHDAMHKALKFGAELVYAGKGGIGIFTPSEADTKFNDLDILVAQDQNGLNAGSFLIRRSVFTQHFIDMWRDPLFVSMDWGGKEQDAMVSKCSI
jgi:hypothetical protein